MVTSDYILQAILTCSILEIAIIYFAHFAAEIIPS
jgi:hypothetical protein